MSIFKNKEKEFKGNSEGDAVAQLYLGKVQRGKMTGEEAVEDMTKKLKRQGYGGASIAYARIELEKLIRDYGDYKW